MDRIRAGLTGLAAVLLVTTGASLLFVPNDEDRIAAELPKEPGEPLAQLGVAPGSDKDSKVRESKTRESNTRSGEPSQPDSAEELLPGPQPSGGMMPGGDPALPSPAVSLPMPSRDELVSI